LEVWKELQQELASQSTNSFHFVVPDFGHDIPTQRPQVIVEAIRAAFPDAPPDVIVNATSLGHGTQSHLAPPIAWPDLRGAWAIDAVYGSEPTPFQVKGAQMGAQVLDGMPMLRMQAKKAWEYWSGMLKMPDF
jgi:shikimate 5-dehydrogenase